MVQFCSNTVVGCSVSYVSLSPPIRSLQVNQFPVCQTFYREFSSWDNYQNLVDVQNIK